jgi:hypothetical protein
MELTPLFFIILPPVTILFFSMESFFIGWTKYQRKTIPGVDLLNLSVSLAIAIPYIGFIINTKNHRPAMISQNRPKRLFGFWIAVQQARPYINPYFVLTAVINT